MVDARFRSKVLMVASALTSDKDRADAVAVNASPLLAWIEGADDEIDMQVRWRAMFQHHVNTRFEPPDDNPERFLAGAKTLYAFTTAGQDAGPGGLPWSL
jgi:hypothetical protein